MLKKTLLRSLNILKISTWITAFIALAILLVIAFFVMFPQTIKGSLEDQLSQVIGLDVEIDKLSLEFQDNELLLAVKNLEISSKDLEPIASIDVLRWNVDLLALYQGIEIPGHIDINELIIDVSSINNYVSIINTDNILSSIGLTRLLALKSLSIDKTRLIGDQSLELAAIELKRNKERLTLSMRDQSLFSNSQIPKLGSALNINTTIDVTKATEDRVAVIPFSLKNEDFNLSAQLKIFNQQDRVYLEFESYIDEIEVSKINQNLPSALANTAAALWLDQVIDKGFLTDISLTTRFNMSGDLDRPNTKFSANLSNANLNLDSKWPSISDLNAKVNFSNDYLRLTSNKAQIDGIDLSYLSITSKDFNMEGSELSVNTRFNSQSKKVSEFIKQSNVPSRFKNYLNEFELEGRLWGNLNLVVPLKNDSNQNPKITFDMYASDNKLSLLNGSLLINEFNSQISFNNGLIQTKGKGLIGNELFQLSLNPKDWITDENAKFKLKLSHLETKTDAYIAKKSINEWHTIIDSDILKSNINLVIEKDGSYDVQLTDSKILNLEGINNWKLYPDFFPSFHLNSSDAKVNGKTIPNFDVDLISHDNVMEIKNLTFENIGLSNDDLVFNGSWFNGRTILRAKATNNNLSDFLLKFKVNEPVIGGAFNADLRLYCDCEPWEVSTKKVSGFMKAKVEKGVFTNQDPNLLKLLSYINLESIADRLRLSRTELRDQGYVYDQINAKFLFNDGVAKVDYFLVESEESDIELTGFVDLIKQDYNLAANVQPSIADTSSSCNLPCWGRFSRFRSLGC